ncbi:MAG: PEP-CTERM sorting domain-containing protein [Verrucomicrobiae bacterium]|nr:PEP-CTERM sorting domain-containing protein [Verrucomicrobiae bacterium]
MVGVQVSKLFKCVVGGTATISRSVSRRGWLWALVIGGVVVGQAAHAHGTHPADDCIQFNLKTPTKKVNPYPGSTTYYKEYHYSAGGINLKVTGWSYHNGKIIQDWVGLWDGLGVERTNSPNHAVDNHNGDYDMLLLCFDVPVALKSLQIGWVHNDSDVSLLALTGGTLSNFTGKVWQALLGEGWESAGDYYDVKQNPNVNPDKIFAECWLVGAYNPNLGGSWLGGNKNVTTGPDYFKLAGLCVIPEPTTVGMVGLAFCGLLPLLRRRR